MNLDHKVSPEDNQRFECKITGTVWQGSGSQLLSGTASAGLTGNFGASTNTVLVPSSLQQHRAAAGSLLEDVLPLCCTETGTDSQKVLTTFTVKMTGRLSHVPALTGQ